MTPSCTTCPRRGSTILDPAYVTSLGTIPDGQAKADGIATGQQVAAILIAQRADDGFRAPVTYTPPDPPIPGVWIPTAQAPPFGTYMQYMRPFSLDTAGQFRPGRPTGAVEQALGTRVQRGEGDRLAHEHDADRRTDAGGALLGASPRSNRRTAGSASSSSTTSSTSSTPRASWRWSPVASADAHYRLLRGQVPLRVLAADHGDPGRRHRRQRRNGRRSRAGCTCLPATPNHPEYPSAHSCATHGHRAR